MGKVLFPRHIIGKGVRIRGSFCFLLCFGSSWILDPPPPLDLTHVATLQKLEDVRKAGISPLYIPQSCIPSCYSVQPGKHRQASFFCFVFLRSTAWKWPKERTGRRNRQRLYLGHERWRVRGAWMRIKGVPAVKSLLGYVGSMEGNFERLTSAVWKSHIIVNVCVWAPATHITAWS